MGLPVLSPQEFEEFLYEEMSQDFSDLGIKIEDFLLDLIKTRQEEEKSFQIYNAWIQNKHYNKESNPILSPVKTQSPTR